MRPITLFTGEWVIPRSGSVPLICHLPPYQKNASMDIAISRCNRLLLYDLQFIHISASSSLMPVPSKISLHPQATTLTVTTDNASATQSAIDFYHANRNTVTTVLHPRKNRSPSQTKKIGISIRRVAAVHSVPFSSLRRTIAAEVLFAKQESIPSIPKQYWMRYP